MTPLADSLHTPLSCRPGCGACCIAPSIATAIPGMPQGKPAGVRCVNLDEKNRCRLWGTAAYPSLCAAFMPQKWVCGETNDDAFRLLTQLEIDTTPTLP